MSVILRYWRRIWLGTTFMSFAARCRETESCTISRPIREKRMRSVPFSCPSDTPIVYAGAMSRTARSSLAILSDSAAWTASTFWVTPA